MQRDFLSIARIAYAAHSNSKHLSQRFCHLFGCCHLTVAFFLTVKLHEFFAKQYADTDAAGFEPAISGLEGQRPILARPRTLTL